MEIKMENETTAPHAPDCICKWCRVERQNVESNERNARLAKAMGWRESPYLIPSLAQPEGIRTFCPPGERVHISNAQHCPDFSTDAAASRALVEWINAQPANVRAKFSQRICAYLPLGGFSISVLDVLTLPLSAIAEAAAEAINATGENNQ